MSIKPTHSQYYKQSLLIGAAIGLGIGISFATGFFIRGFVGTNILQASANDYVYPLLVEVQTLLDRSYLREQPSPKEREYAAIRGMLNLLEDRYTFFIDPPVARSESDVLAGTYGGIGVQLQRSENGDLIIYPFDDSPARQLGVEDGDVLLSVNDVPLNINIQSDALDQMLRGEVKEGSGVSITIKKYNTDEVRSLFIPFAVINVPSVTWRLLDNNPEIGYIRISLFTSRTPSEINEALLSLKEQEVLALVLDLRNNGGGLLQESIEVASRFLDGGIIVYEKTFSEERALNAIQDGLPTVDLPLIVLVNQNTASAAELVAGAIRDRNRGILIGQRTYGKGTVQQIFRLQDESSLHVTSAEWLTPTKEHIDGEGLTPNIEMIPDPDGRDVELGEAIRYLTSKLPQ